MHDSENSDDNLIGFQPTSESFFQPKKLLAMKLFEIHVALVQEDADRQIANTVLNSASGTYATTISRSIYSILASEARHPVDRSPNLGFDSLSSQLPYYLGLEDPDKEISATVKELVDELVQDFRLWLKNQHQGHYKASWGTITLSIDENISLFANPVNR